MLQWISEWMSSFYLYFLGKWKRKSLSHAWLFTTPCTIYSLWNSSSQNTRVGSHSLLQGIFPNQGWKPGLPHCRQILYQLRHQGNPPRRIPDPKLLLYAKWKWSKKMFDYYAFDFLMIAHMDPNWAHMDKILWMYSQFLIYYLKFLYIYINNKLKC